LTDFIVRVRVEAGPAGALTPDNSPDSLARTGSYTVRGNENCSVAQPDLAIGATDLAFTGLRGQGNDQVIAAVVHNTGTLTALNVALRFAVDGTQVGAVQRIASIEPGATARASVVWDTHGNGTHTVVVTADPANAITESSESNNSGSRLVTVHGGRVG
jgi:subtilase family serine protease